MIETVGALKKAYLATHPDADRAALNKAGEKFRRLANSLNDVASYIMESGVDNALAHLGSFYAETLEVADGRDTANRERAQEARRMRRWERQS